MKANKEKEKLGVEQIYVGSIKSSMCREYYSIVRCVSLPICVPSPVFRKSLVFVLASKRDIPFYVLSRMAGFTVQALRIIKLRKKKNILLVK